MKVIAIINLKGGVAKTISAINMGYVLVVNHGKKVLIVDNDKQANTSKFFDLHSYDYPSISDVLTKKNYHINNAIRNTQYEGLDLLPANMQLLNANKEILLDVARPQQTRLLKALATVTDIYDFIIIDNAPDLNMSVINALVAANDVLIPIKIDRFAFDGLDILIDQVEEIKEFNPDIRIAGSFVTMFQHNRVNSQGVEELANHRIPAFKTVIRKTTRIDESTFTGEPIMVYSKNSTAAKDYAAIVDEYLKL